MVRKINEALDIVPQFTRDGGLVTAKFDVDVFNRKTGRVEREVYSGSLPVNTVIGKSFRGYLKELAKNFLDSLIPESDKQMMKREGKDLIFTLSLGYGRNNLDLTMETEDIAMSDLDPYRDEYGFNRFDNSVEAEEDRWNYKYNMNFNESKKRNQRAVKKLKEAKRGKDLDLSRTPKEDLDVWSALDDDLIKHIEEMQRSISRAERKLSLASPVQEVLDQYKAAIKRLSNNILS